MNEKHSRRSLARALEINHGRDENGCLQAAYQMELQCTLVDAGLLSPSEAGAAHWRPQPETYRNGRAVYGL